MSRLEDSVKQQNLFSDISTDRTDESAKHKIKDNMHQILMACATYLTETYGIELKLIYS